MSIKKVNGSISVKNSSYRGESLVLILLIVCFAVASGTVLAQKREAASRGPYVPYRDARLPIEKRIDDLLGRMTLQEKIGQMCQYSAYSSSSKRLAVEGRVGSFLNVTSPNEIDELQSAAVKKSRLGIPILFGLDVIHGYSTIFPIPLAQASSWDPALVKECASIAAKEASSQGIRWTFSPMVDIARDPRWGRIAEGAGEDPYLGMVMAKAQVEGYQGRQLSPESDLVACAKHYVAYGAAEGGRDYNTAEVSQRTLREIYLPPFKAAVDAGVGTIMSAFDDLDGVPASANPFTIRQILKKEWSFKGFVVSDWQAVSELINQGIACDSSEAAMKAVEAGVDMDMAGPYHDCLAGLVEAGKVPIRVIDDAVRRILRVKFELGLFEKPYVETAKSKSSLMLPDYLKIARQEACESIVLLKNDGEILPLSRNTKTVAVIGPLADDEPDMLGCWHCRGQQRSVVSVIEGIKSKLSENSKLIYVKGCGVNDTSTAGFPQALQAAKKADVVIMVIGERANMSGEAESRSSINIPGVQEQLAKEIVHLGRPVVEVLMNGRPLSIAWSAEHVPAIVETWFLGTEAGNAIADVLFGDYNPSGKLPVTFPRTVGQIPIYYNHMNTGRPPSATDRFTSKYIDLPSTPLFPFGYGLSYTRFKYSNLSVVPDPKVPDQFSITFNLTNVGQRTGEDVAQLYIHPKCASVTRPVEQLAGFRRVALAPGETKVVHLTLTPYEISFINSDMRRVVETGDLDVMVGGNSVNLISKKVHIDKSMAVNEDTIGW